MVNEQKIITMTKLALYDKNEANTDQEANDYFRHDYVYRKNLSTRIAVGCGGILILIIYWMNVVFSDGGDFFELDFTQLLIESILFMVALLALFSFLGTIQSTREYYLMQKRLNNYQLLVRQLERIEERARQREDADLSHGAGIDN